MTVLIDCARFEDDLKAYCDGELSWPRRLTVRRHLTRCASCREEIAIMTQIAEDLRTTEIETEDALDPALRAKILGIGEPHPARSSPPSPLRGEGISVSPGQGGFRKRPIPAWAIAGVALVAWFVFFPTFQKVRENARRAPAIVTAARPASDAPSKPQTFTVHMSNREAGNAISSDARTADSSANIQITDPDSKFANVAGRLTSNAGTTPMNSTVAGSVGTYNSITPVPPSAAEPQRQVHKEASIGVQVPSPEASSDTVETMVKETGGYVASNNLGTGDDGLQTAELIVKVPVTEFETFLSQTAKLGKLQSKSLSGEDITEKTSDADQEEGVLEDDTEKSEARLKALGSKAKWHDEQATRDLRIQLAQSRARLVLLKRMAALATITIDLSQTPKAVVPVPVTGGFLSGLKATTHDALQSLLNSAGALLALVIWLLAYAPVWIPLLLVGRYALREYRKRQVV